jgi:hypothetical protein
MLLTTDFKRFDPGVEGYSDDITAMVLQAAGKKNCVIEVRVMEQYGTRQKKQTARSALQELIKERGTAVWKEGAYVFDFGKNKYYRRSRELYFTAGEALFLYHWLVAGVYPREQRYHFSRLRQKFGKAFLAEVGRA